MNQRVFWHDEKAVPRGKAHEHVFPHVTTVDSEQCELHNNNRDYARLYSNREEPGLNYSLRSTWRPGDLVTENIIKQVVDTATSLIGKSRPRIRIMSDEAEWDMQQVAQDLEKYLDGMFKTLAVHRKLTRIFRDACVFGTGCLYFGIRKSQIVCERVLIDEIVVDEKECPAGELPRQLHRVRRVSREVLKRLYPKKAQDIDDSSSSMPSLLAEQAGGNTDPDMVVLIESYHLGPGGRYTACTDKVTLVDEPYAEECYPFVFYHWNPPLTGFYGQGLAEELLGFQIRLNELNDFIQQCQDLVGVPRVAVDAGSKFMKPHLNNEIGAVLPYVGKPPVWMTPPSISGDIYQYKEQLKQAALEFAGISRMAATAARPEGVEHAVAMRELSDNQSQRFSDNQQRFEDGAIECGELVIHLASKLHKSSGKVPYGTMAKDFVKAIDWEKADLKEQQFVLSIQAASIMGETPSGKLQRILELAQYGVQLDQSELRRLLAHPDIGLSDQRANAERDDAEWVCSQLLRGDPEPPEGLQDLELCIDRVKACYLVAKRRGAPEGLLQGMRNWLTEAKRVKDEADKAMAAKQQAMTQMNPGMPGMMGPQPGSPPLPAASMLDAGALPGLMMPLEQPMAAPPL